VLFVASALQVFELGAEGNGGLANAAGKAVAFECACDQAGPDRTSWCGL
jgi:hypothetical protein